MTDEVSGVQVLTPGGDRDHPWVQRFLEALARNNPVDVLNLGLTEEELVKAGEKIICDPSMKAVHAQRSTLADQRRIELLSEKGRPLPRGWRRLQIYTNTVSEMEQVDAVFTDVLLATVVRSSDALPGYVWNDSALDHALDAERCVLDAARTVFVPTEWLARDIRTNLGQEVGSKVRVVGWGPGNEGLSSKVSNWNAWRRRRSRRVELLFVANEGARKGLDSLVDGLKAIRTAGVDAHLTLVGDLPEIREPGVTNTGYLDTRSPAGLRGLRRAFRRADLLVLPVSFDPVGCVFIEAMQAGLAVIANEVCAVGELVSPECGWLVGRDATTLEEAMLAACTGDELLAKRRSAKERGAKFNWNATANAIVAELGVRDARCA